MVSATTGVVEYTSNVFHGDLKGELILSKYAASGSGTTWRTKVKDNNVNLIQMTGYSGINVINGLYGELIMPRVQQGFVAVLKPKYSAGSAPFVIAVTPRRGVAGSQVYVSGENFVEGSVVKFGGTVATVKSFVSKNGMFVTVPPGKGAVSVVVSYGVSSSSVYPGYDFIYV
ncbi:IPT/TIG [Gracilaria domingensis]|nr:IPT/TIG [Gracilaria domingensis]